MLNEDGAYAEEAKMLEPFSAKQSDNTPLHLMLGVAEMKAGRVEEGSKILTALLKDTTDTAVLNDASYELADKNMQLDLAEASVQKALDKLTKDSAALTLDADLKASKAQARTLVTLWHTMGWVYFREKKFEEAEEYLRAAWLNAAQPGMGLHLGQVQQARGRIDDALATYQQAQRTGISYQSDGSRSPATATDRELSRRVDALRRKGVRDKSADKASMSSDRLRKLRVGPAEGQSGSTTYTVLMTDGHVNAVKGDKDNVTMLRGGDEMVKRWVAADWWPKDSNAKMLRQGVLNCQPEVCYFAMLPL